MGEKTTDGRAKRSYPVEITVNLTKKQYDLMRHHFGWMGEDEYVAYFLIVDQVVKRGEIMSKIAQD